jgi:hypothetical protein
VTLAAWESQRDSVSKPGVASLRATLGLRRERSCNPDRVVPWCAETRNAPPASALCPLPLASRQTPPQPPGDHRRDRKQHGHHEGVCRRSAAARSLRFKRLAAAIRRDGIPSFGRELSLLPHELAISAHQNRVIPNVGDCLQLPTFRILWRPRYTPGTLTADQRPGRVPSPQPSVSRCGLGRSIQGSAR